MLHSRRLHVMEQSTRRGYVGWLETITDIDQAIFRR